MAMVPPEPVLRINLMIEQSIVEFEFLMRHGKCETSG